MNDPGWAITKPVKSWAELHYWRKQYNYLQNPDRFDHYSQWWN